MDCLLIFNKNLSTSIPALSVYFPLPLSAHGNWPPIVTLDSRLEIYRNFMKVSPRNESRVFIAVVTSSSKICMNAKISTINTHRSFVQFFETVELSILVFPSRPDRWTKVEMCEISSIFLPNLPNYDSYDDCTLTKRGLHITKHNVINSSLFRVLFLRFRNYYF